MPYICLSGRSTMFFNKFLKRVLSESQGGEVTFEQVQDFFNTGRQTEDDDQEDETQIKLL
jgi:hypothetical protein